jgi:hypothetical protein
MRRFNEGQEKRIIDSITKRVDEYQLNGRDIAFNATIAPFHAERAHVIECGLSILCTKWGLGYPGGSFVQAMVDNDLTQAFGRADHINVNAIRFYVSLLYNQSYIE